MKFRKLVIGIIFFISSNNALAENKSSERIFHVSANDLKHSESAIYFAEKNKWQEATYSASILQEEAIKKLIAWLKFSNDPKVSSFEDIINFIKQNPDWPDIENLRKNAEWSINNSTKYSTILNWFKKNPPLTSNGFKYYAIALSSLSENYDNNVVKAIKEGWIKGSFTEEEEQVYIKNFGHILIVQDHIARTDELVWQKRTSQAKRMFIKLDKAHQTLFKARIDLQENKFPDLTIIQANLAHDAGLMFELLNYYNARKDEKKVREILKHNIISPYSDRWWKIRVREIRELLAEKKYQLAYNLSKVHNNKDISNYADAEWLSGWIALSFLKNPELAYKHFTNLYKLVKSPISKSRGAYWAAKSIKGKDPQISKEWYKKAALHPETFYGQLAIIEAGNKNLSLPPLPIITANDLANYKNSDLVKAAYICARLQKYNLAKTLLKAAINNSKTPAEAYLVTELGTKMNIVSLSVNAAKEAARKSIILTKTNFPILSDINKIEHIEKALALAIIRQESVFDHRAESHAGAIGLMQLLPGTAQDLAKELKIAFYKPNLKTDPSYNVRLGSYYLKKLIERFQGSYILGIAAYNAGARNVDKWVEEYGDPRNYNDIDSIINWIESIPFYETRNYVHRVLENLQIYRLILDGKLSNTLEIEQDLMRVNLENYM
ncbi:MAG: lytic transglycosylase domain-containing protein [Alphaproteobacteria bacterium]